MLDKEEIRKSLKRTNIPGWKWECPECKKEMEAVTEDRVIFLAQQHYEKKHGGAGNE